MSLPLQAVDRLFERLMATYGRDFVSKFEGVEANAVKAAWSHELSGFASNLQAIAWALENLPPRAPNAVEFRHLCRQAPAADTPRLPDVPADPERIRAELAKLDPAIQSAKRAVTTDRLAWARRIVSRRQAGERVAHGTYSIAAGALKGRGEEV